LVLDSDVTNNFSKAVWMKKSLLVFFLLITYHSLFAQKVLNYDKNGRKLKTASEFVDLSIENTPGQQAPEVESAITGILLGPVYNIVSSFIQNQLKKRQQQYIASYGNSVVFPDNEIKSKGERSLIIRRYAINTLDDVNDEHLMAEYVLPITTDKNSITLSLKSVLLNRSKARYRSKDKLSLSIQVSITNPLFVQPIVNEGTIVVPIAKVTGETKDFSEYKNVINKIRLSQLEIADSLPIKFLVTITETNISKIEPSEVQRLISNNSEELRTILKAALGPGR